MRVYLSCGKAEQLDVDALRRALAGRQPGLELALAAHRNEAGAYLTARLQGALASADVVVLMLGEQIGAWQALEYFEAHRRLREDGRPTVVAVQLGERMPALPGLDRVRCLDARTQGLAELVAGILGQGEPPPPLSWRNFTPYAGLAPLDLDTSAFLLGRELAVTRLLGALSVSPNRVHVVVGNAGVGKSSLLGAGVLAALRSQMWPIAGQQGWPEALADSRAWPLVRMRPGARPLQALARAFVSLWRESPTEIDEEAARWHERLAQGGGFEELAEAALSRVAFRMDAEPPRRLVLCVDQAEELYALAAVEERTRFSRLMAQAAASPDALVLMALRSDGYGALQADSELYPVVRTTDMAPPEPVLLEALVRMPAGWLGVRLSSEDAIEQLTAAASRAPGALPLLADCLADAWSGIRTGPDGAAVLPLPRGLIDIARPLVDRTERFIAAHPGSEAVLLRLFTSRLAVLPRDGDFLARRAARGECSEGEWSLLTAMAEPAWRLVRLDAGGRSAELAHEILLRAWPRVAAWLDESREFMVWKVRFEADYRRWEEAGDDGRASTLLSGLPLELAKRWSEQRPADLSPGECLFIDESRLAESAAGASARVAARRQVLQRRWTLGLVLLALVGVAALAVVTLEQRRDAEAVAQQAQWQGEQARQAREDALRQVDRLNAARLALEAGRLIDAGGDARLALLLGAESLRLAPSAEGVLAVRRALALTPAAGEPLAWPWPDAQRLATADGQVEAFVRMSAASPAIELRRRTDEGQESLALEVHGTLHDVRLSDDGRWVAGLEGEARLPVVWDALSGTRREGAEGVARLAFAGSLLLESREGRQLTLSEAGGGGEGFALGLAAGVSAVQLASDGRTLVSFGEDGRFRGWDGPSGRPLWASRSARPSQPAPVISGDGEWFAQAASEGAAVEIGDVASGRVTATLPIDRSGTLTLSDDGARLLWQGAAASDHEGELQLWDTAAARLLHRRPLRGDAIALGFLPGGRLLALADGFRAGASGSGYLELIDGEDGSGLWRLPLAAGAPAPIEMGPGLLALPDANGARLLTRAGQLSFELGEGRPVVAAAADGAGRWLALARAGSDGGTRIEWRERVRGELLGSVDVDGQVLRLLTGPGGDALLALVRRDDRTWILAWAGSEGRRLGRFRVDGEVSRILLLPDGDRVALLDGLGQLRLRRLRDGQPAGTLSHRAVADDWWAAATAPVAVVRVGTTLQWWDLATRTVKGVQVLKTRPGELALSPDGRVVAWLEGDGQATVLRLWRPADDASPATAYPGPARDLAFSRDGSRLRVRVGQDTVQVYGADGLGLQGRIQVPAGDPLTVEDFVGDGRWLAVEAGRGGQRQLSIHGTVDGRERARLALSGHWTTLADTGGLVVQGTDGAWRAVDPDSASADQVLLEAGFPALRRLPGARRLLADVDDATWQSLPAEIRQWLTRPAAAGVAPDAVWAVDPAGERLAVVAPDGVGIVDAADGRRVAEWPDVRFAPVSPDGAPRSAAGRGERLQFIDSGNGLVAFDTVVSPTDGPRSRLWLWRWVDGPAREIGDGNPVAAVAATPDGRWLASAEGAYRPAGAPARPRTAGRAQLRIWDGRDGSVRRTVPLDLAAEAVRFSPSGEHIALRTAAEVLVLSTDDGQVTARLPIPSGEVRGALHFAGENQIALGTVDGLRLWSVDTGELRTIDGGRVIAAIEGPDGGGPLLAADSQGLAGLWDTADGLRRVEAVPGVAPVDAFMPGSDGEVWMLDAARLRRLNWTAQALVPLACQRAAGPLTDGEWARYLGDLPRPGACDPR
ncbi:MAG: hypothetical protein KDG55_00790 [Rhodocyclaceae bacterium]|nr:hypothetical protein [Rhodocyclaceae bacterium]